MEHITSLDVARPWRTATLVASSVAAAELLVILVIGAALLGRPLAERTREQVASAPTAPATPPPAPPKRERVEAPHLTRGETSVRVLNGNGRTGAASATAADVRAMGYLVSAVGNATRSDHTRTVVMYRRGYAGEASRLARDLRVTIVAPLDDMRPAELMGAHLALVVGE